jgi:hypothetical protein
MKKGVVFLKGGFGNQLFQFAFANYLQNNGFNITINTSDFELNSKDTPRQIVIPLDAFGFKEQSSLSSNIFKAAHYLESNTLIRKLKLHHLVKEYKFTKEHEDLMNLNLNRYFFNSYWKDLNYLNFSKHFMIESLIKHNEIKQGYKSSTEDCMIHVRRGDFIKDDRHLHIDFYKKSIDILKKTRDHCNIDIFTDDYDWVSSQKIFKDVNNIYGQKAGKTENSRGIDGIDDKSETISTFSSMLRYKHFIVGNSSFAFWAAFLKSGRESVVVVPSPWFRNHTHPVLKKDNWYVVKNS